jgi:hypothetical protein
MSVTSKLKRGVDLPIWEWARPLPVITGTTVQGPSTIATGGKPEGRYLYYISHATNGSFRYDTYTDGWTTITTTPYAQTSIASSRYNDYHGYSARMLSATSNTFQAAVPKGNKCVGKTMRIVSGTGAGQVRVITAVSDPIVEAVLTATTSNALQVVDVRNFATTINQYRDYGMRIVTNLASDCRKIIYNSLNTIVFADNTFSSVGLPWAYSALPANTTFGDGGETRVQIESYTVTVDTPWTTTPDNTSVFVIQSGMIWNVNAGGTKFGFQSYDVLNDNWYVNNSILGGMLNAGVIATDIAIETLNESSVGVLLSASVASATLSSVTLSGVTSYTPDQYANYIVRITGGTGIGQDRFITTHGTSGGLTINRKWDTIPDITSIVNIVADNDKMYMTGNGGGALLEYDALNDIWSDRRILEVGCPSNLCAVWNGFKRPVALSTITRVGTTATATAVNTHGLKTGDIVTIYGTTEAFYNAVNVAITVTTATQFTYTMAGTPTNATAVIAASQSSTLLVDPSKSWAVNELVGKIISYTTTPFASTTFITNYHHRIITSNTATTITFASGTAPIAGTTAYMITDMRCHGGIFASQLNGTPTATSLPVVNTITAGTNVYSGLRATVIDGANWGEVAITANTATTITLAGTGLAFVPTTNAFVTVLGVAATGAGCSLEYMYNTSNKQKGRYMFGLRGGATNYMYIYDITSNTWDTLNQMPNSEIFSTGTMTAYDGDDRIYIQRDNTGRVLYYDFTDNNLYAYNQIPYGMGAATLGNKMNISKTEDGLKFIYIPRHVGAEFWRSLLWI